MTTPNKKPCPDCKGEKTAAWHGDLVACPTCHGTGIDPAQETDSDRLAREHNEMLGRVEHVKRAQVANAARTPDGGISITTTPAQESSCPDTLGKMLFEAGAGKRAWVELPPEIKNAWEIRANAFSMILLKQGFPTPNREEEPKDDYLHKKLLTRVARAMNHIGEYANSPRDPNFKKDYEAAWWEAEYCLVEIRNTLGITKQELYQPKETHG